MVSWYYLISILPVVFGLVFFPVVYGLLPTPVIKDSYRRGVAWLVGAAALSTLLAVFLGFHYASTGLSWLSLVLCATTAYWVTPFAPKNF